MLGKAIGYSALGLGIAGTTVAAGAGSAYLSAQTDRGDPTAVGFAGGLATFGVTAGTVGAIKGVPALAKKSFARNSKAGIALQKAFYAPVNGDLAKLIGKNSKIGLAFEKAAYAPVNGTFEPFLKGAGKTLGKGALNVGAVGSLTAVKAGAKYGNLALSMFKMNPTQKGRWFKTTGYGKAAIGLGAIAYGGTKAFNQFNEARRGDTSGPVLTATPTSHRGSQVRNAGATGDLAFAAHATRRG